MEWRLVLAMYHEPQIIIGERHGWGNTIPFGISAVDQRQHIYVIGKTGSGKTVCIVSGGNIDSSKLVKILAGSIP